MNSTLTEKRARFVEEYLRDRNAAQAAIRAGYSPRCARSIGHELLTKPDVAQPIQERARELAREVQLDQRRVLAELVEAAEMAKSVGDANGMIGAWCEISRLLGLYPSQRSLVHQPRASGDLSQLPDETLRHMADGTH